MEDPALQAVQDALHAKVQEIGTYIQPIADRFVALQQKLDGSLTPEEQKQQALEMQPDVDALSQVATSLAQFGTPTAPV